MADIWAKYKEGECPSYIETTMFDSKLTMPDTIHFNRVYIGNEVDKLVFADGAVFVRAHNKD